MAENKIAQQQLKGEPENLVISEKPQTNGQSNGEPSGASQPQTNGASHDKPEESEASSKDAHDEKKEKQPEGGFDKTKLPRQPPGYTLKITFHKAENLPMADIGTLSSDPFILAQLSTSLPVRHKEDPPLMFRTPTVRRETNPVWNSEWILANVPASGFRLKCRIYDEDPADHDDRLGNVTLHVNHIDDNWQGIKNQDYNIKKRMGSKRAYMLRAMSVCVGKNHHMDGHLHVSVENLGRTKDEDGSRCYTLGPMWWTKHYSPMLGRLTGRTEDNDGDGRDDGTGKEVKKAQQYKYANQFQLHGPTPPELYHRYVEFKPFVKLMFTSSGIAGWILSKGLHHQHARVYNFDRSTEYGSFPEPSKQSTLKFLDLVHWDKGGRIFTYVLTLDSLFRFTETGKEFGIDFLSKHTMHSDVSIYIAFSGEFFVRRLKHKHRKSPDEPGESEESAQNQSHPPASIEDGSSESEPPKDPEHYELVIDNDSGTYRPNADLLPLLKKFLEFNLPGLHIITLDCQKDADRQQRMKKEQREKKEKEGEHVIYRQHSRGSSISSSDISDLDHMEAAAANDGSPKKKKHKNVQLASAMGRDLQHRGSGRKDHYKNIFKGRDKGGNDPKSSKMIEEEGHAAQPSTNIVEGHTSDETPKGAKPTEDVQLNGHNQALHGESSATKEDVTGEALKSEPEGSQSLPSQTTTGHP
ncbi:C2-like protein [Venturia nashicola]|uniref:C2-like protein n=1 Tax=Venturia nashicola TaxID=86259 RepID=A0A4Z1PFX1_9PEZI|nr:C2-like protein [Venturia nashicola]